MLYFREMPSAAPISVTSKPGALLQQRRQPALGILDRVLVEQHFLALGTIDARTITPSRNKRSTAVLPRGADHDFARRSAA